MAYLKRRVNYLAFSILGGFRFIGISHVDYPGSSTAEDTIIYGANAWGFTDVIEINLTANTSQKVGDLEFETQAIDQHPLNGKVYYFEWDSSGDRLSYWDPMDRYE